MRTSCGCYGWDSVSSATSDWDDCISLVSTLIKWFPTGAAWQRAWRSQGFGGGAMIGSPLATSLMAKFASPGDPGVWQTFVALAAIYFVFMMMGSFAYRVPLPGGGPPDGRRQPQRRAAR